MDFTLLFTLVVGSILVAITVAMVVLRRQREERDIEALRLATEKNRHLPASLHPVIDPNICIGSLSCLTACPEGDILGIIDGAAKLIEATNCIGHGRCAAECPVDAIKLVFGTSQRGVDLPHVDEFFQTSRPGVHVVGELGGMGLIKNAVNQGLQVSEALAKRIQPRRGGAGAGVDVLIVGAGPAGLAAAVGCHSARLSYRIVDQDTLGGTITHYPRQKVVMSEALMLPGYGKIGNQFISKEDLLATWGKVTRKMKIKVEEKVKVTGITGADGAFEVETSAGKIKAQKVVLAVGRRGSPRTLGVAGEDLPKVSYRLLDPDQYAGCKVLVVGGGDSALEAACQIASESDAEVTLCHRSESVRGRGDNQAKLDAAVANKRIRLLLSTQIERIKAREVLLKVGGREKILPNDYVIICAGGELPLEFLKKVGVDVQRLYGTELGHAVTGEQQVVVPRGTAKEEAKRRQDDRLALLLFTLGAVIVAALAVIGWDYYRLPRLERLRSPLHQLLRPAGVWGHGVGIISTAFMLTNFLYSVRKRWTRLKRTGEIRRWLTVHMFVGFMAPILISFHAAFQSKNKLATITAASLGVVVLTGIVGRFIYGLVPSHNGKAVAYADLLGRWERLKATIAPLLADLKDPRPVQEVLAHATAPPGKGSLANFIFKMPGESLNTHYRIRQVRHLFEHPALYEDFRAAFWRMWRIRTAVRFYRGLKLLLSNWRMFHAVLAILLAFLITAHVGVELYLGYFWIFK